MSEVDEGQHADDVAAYDPDPPPKCDHICLSDDGHVERGERHFYGYELPSPRRQHADPGLLRAAFDAGVYAGGMADPRVTEAHLDEQFAAWLAEHSDGPEGGA